MASLADVARAAGVSTSVASRALTGDTRARVSDQTRARVAEAAAALDYVPNQRARALRQSRSGAIALIVPDVNNAVFSQVLAGVQDSTARRSTDVLLGQVASPHDGAKQLSRLVREGRVDGILIQRREDFDDEDLAAVLGSGIPAVTINSRLPDRIGSVILDDQAGAATATQHLLDLGHRRLALISGTTAHDAARRREEGFRAALHAAGITPVDNWVVNAGWEADAGASAIHALHERGSNLGGADGPTGVVVASVNAAVGAVSTAQRLGLDVPRQLSVVAINSTWVAESVHPALTTVALPLRELGSVAAELLLAHLDGAPLENVVIQEPAPELAVRDTSTPPS